METPIRVLLVDDHTLFRSGIKSLLQTQSDFQIVGEAGDGHEGVKRAQALRPHVVLLDLHMPGISGCEALELILEGDSPPCVLMLTVSEDADDLLSALQTGARGYLLKNIDANFLIDAVRRAAAGESVISPQMTTKLMASVRRASRSTSLAPPLTNHDKLTQREREIIAILARGVSNKEIARTLELAESTVKIHVQSILRKLNLASRVQAAVYAVEHGLAHKN